MTTITLKLPDDLAQQLQQFDTETLSELIKKLLVLYISKKDLVTQSETQNIEADSWLEFLDNIDQYAIDTGIEDLSRNHDHYLYGTPKR